LEVKEYIISESDKLFCQYGFKSVTMDDIAKHLGMSKKTIYAHFCDKNEIVNIVIDMKLNSQKCVIKENIEAAENAVHEMFFAVTSMKELLSNMNPTLFYDLQKYGGPRLKKVADKIKKETNQTATYAKNHRRNLSRRTNSTH
jgi:AcrR family transcriptional regulator